MFLDYLFPLMWFPLWFSCTLEVRAEQAALILDAARVGPDFGSGTQLD